MMTSSAVGGNWGGVLLGVMVGCCRGSNGAGCKRGAWEGGGRRMGEGVVIRVGAIDSWTELLSVEIGTSLVVDRVR